MRLLRYLMLVSVLLSHSSDAISAAPAAPSAAVLQRQHRRLNPWSSPLAAGNELHDEIALATESMLAIRALCDAPAR